MKGKILGRHMIKKLHTIYLMFIIIALKSFGVTVSNVLNSNTQKVVVEGNGASVKVNMPQYIYRERDESVNGVLLFQKDELWRLGVSSKTADSANIRITLNDNNNGTYEYRNVSYEYGNNKVKITEIAPFEWEVTNLHANESKEQAAFTDMYYLVPTSAPDGVYNVTNTGQFNFEGYGTRSVAATTTFRLFTYTNVEVEEMNFGTLIPNSSVIYQKTSNIRVGGGANNLVKIGMTTESGTFFGKEVTTYLTRAGGTQTIPIKVSIIGDNGTIIDSLVLDSHGDATAQLKGVIDGRDIDGKVPKGRYNGTVLVEVKME